MPSLEQSRLDEKCRPQPVSKGKSYCGLSCMPRHRREYLLRSQLQIYRTQIGAGRIVANSNGCGNIRRLLRVKSRRLLFSEKRQGCSYLYCTLVPQQYYYVGKETLKLLSVSDARLLFGGKLRKCLCKNTVHYDTKGLGCIYGDIAEFFINSFAIRVLFEGLLQLVLGLAIIVRCSV
jgi:hypothetical protein